MLKWQCHGIFSQFHESNHPRSLIVCLKHLYSTYCTVHMAGFLSFEFDNFNLLCVKQHTVTVTVQSDQSILTDVVVAFEI